MNLPIQTFTSSLTDVGHLWLFFSLYLEDCTCNHIKHGSPHFFPSLSSALQVRTENLVKEKEMLRQAEHRLTREKEVMLVEQRNQNLLLSNLKIIQV